jgi:hypothetical protein
MNRIIQSTADTLSVESADVLGPPLVSEQQKAAISESLGFDLEEFCEKYRKVRKYVAECQATIRSNERELQDRCSEIENVRQQLKIFTELNHEYPDTFLSTTLRSNFDAIEKELRESIVDSLDKSISENLDNIRNEYTKLVYLNNTIEPFTGEKYVCAICTEHPIDSVFTGCGHTACETCILKLKRGIVTECPFCRNRSGTKRLFT